MTLPLLQIPVVSWPTELQTGNGEMQMDPIIHVSLVWMHNSEAGVPFIDQTTVPVKIFITGTIVSITPHLHVSFVKA